MSKSGLDWLACGGVCSYICMYVFDVIRIDVAVVVAIIVVLAVIGFGNVVVLCIALAHPMPTLRQGETIDGSAIKDLSRFYKSYERGSPRPGIE